jgi:outer membrane protein assembly factor BamB
MRFLLPCGLVGLLAACHLPAAEKLAASAKPFDWPQWQGPDRTAVSRETGLLPAWPKGGPPLLWKVNGLGEGFSTPSVAAGRLFLMGNRDQTEYVIALAEDNGKELWAASVGPVRADGGGFPGPRCTPTADGQRVFALGLNGDLICLESATGKELWRKDLVKQFGGSPGGWGYAESPLIDGDRLICTPGGKTATLAALDKKTGQTIWKAAVPEGDSAQYSSIVAADLNGTRQYVQFLSGGVVGVAADDGRFLWRYTNPANGTANCSTPICHDNCVFAASSYGAGGGLARITGEGKKQQAEEVYFTKKMQNHHGGMVLVDGYLYGSNEGSVTCLEYTTGKIQWEERRPGKGSIVCADGRICYRNENGPVILFEANPRKYVETGRFEQPDRSDAAAWPHPIIANGRLYLRDQDVLLCYDVKKK